MIRVLHLINSLDVGGGERFAVELVRRLDRERYEPRVVCLFGAGELRDRLDSARIPVDVLGLGRDLTPSGWARVWRALRTVRPAVLHAHLPEACWQGAPAAWMARVPVRICHVQNSHWRWPPKLRRLDRTASAFATHVIASSDAVRRFCETEVGVRPDKIRVIHNAIDTGRFQGLPTGDEARGRLGLPPGVPILICVASLTEQKGHRYLLTAMARILRALPATELLLVGDGPLREDLSRLAGELSIAEHVRFLGPRSDVPSILAAADVFVLPSLWEGLPLALTEAGAAGLPAVATRVDGNGEVMDEGRTGLIVAPGDPDQLAVAVMTLLENRERAREMGLRARERVGERFDIDAAVMRVEDLYVEAVRGAGAT